MNVGYLYGKSNIRKKIPTIQPFRYLRNINRPKRKQSVGRLRYNKFKRPLRYKIFNTKSPFECCFVPPSHEDQGSLPPSYIGGILLGFPYKLRGEQHQQSYRPKYKDDDLDELFNKEYYRYISQSLPDFGGIGFDLGFGII